MKPQSPSLIQLRLLAVKTLAQVYIGKKTLEESMTEVLLKASSKTFPDFARSWIYEVCSGVLRYRGRVDYIVDTYALKKKPTGAIRRFLQIAVFQLLAQDVEAALVVSETVQAIRDGEGLAPSQFANALLRKVADARTEWREWKITEETPFLEQVAWCSIPEWLFKILRKERGSEWVFQFSKASLERPVIWYRTREMAKILENGFQGDEESGFVQDISNQKLVEKTIEMIRKNLKPNPKILDLCSAPGGKSMALAFAGFSVVATDIDEKRLQRVTENRSRLELKTQIDIRDLNSIRESDEKFDLIWIDAPCSSVGIMRRHPEIKWNRNQEDVLGLVQKQKDLLTHWKTRLNEGGILLYSTCSVLNEENPTSLEGLKSVLSFEAFPQDEPFGDGIRAQFFKV